MPLLRAIYYTVESCVPSNGNYSDFFPIHTGVKQGKPLSLFLFILFVNDMYENIVIQGDDAFTSEDLKFFILLFAEDIVLLCIPLRALLDRTMGLTELWGSYEPLSDRTLGLNTIVRTNFGVEIFQRPTRSLA